MSDLCFGCRVKAGLPAQLDDHIGLMAAPPPGFHSVARECAGCGVIDVFLVRDDGTETSTREVVWNQGQEG